MSSDERITQHWTLGGLAEAILAALEEAGVDAGKATAADLAPLDHLHGRGVEATRELMAKLAPGPGHHLLDIGSGIGGPARLAASEFGARVTGIDLTREFCEVAGMLTEMTGLAGRVTFRHGSALKLPFADGDFDGAYTQNVSMNIADKAAFYGEARRVLKPGAPFIAAEYAEGSGPPHFPVPWAETSENSHLVEKGEIRRLLEDAGFEVVEFTDQTDVFLDYYERSRRRLAAEGPPVLGAHVLISGAKDKLRNSARSVEDGRTIPIQAVCRRR